jgi:hypothetical protein
MVVKLIGRFQPPPYSKNHDFFPPPHLSLSTDYSVLATLKRSF